MEISATDLPQSNFSPKVNDMNIDAEKIPVALRALDQWVLWDLVPDGKDGWKKLPFDIAGGNAKSNDRTTWTEFKAVVDRHKKIDCAGIGFVFSAEDEFCGVDLDGCRDPETGKVAEWARQIILAFDSYAEVSPSGTGVKIFCIGKCPFPTGKKVAVDEEKMGDKTPAIEIYDHLRYFAVTGQRLRGPFEPEPRQPQLDWLKESFWPAEPAKLFPDFRGTDAVMDRAAKYLAKLPGSVSGSGGHNAAFHAACILVLGFGLDEFQAMTLMNEFNQRCSPPWSERELRHKVSQAMKQPGERGFLRNTSPANWNKVNVPSFKSAVELKPEPRETTVTEAAKAYIETIRHGQTPLIETGIPDLDYSIGGGVEKGEMIIFAARPSHGKSMAAMQCIHHWTSQQSACGIISEEMSALLLGKRTLQYISNVHQEHWQENIDKLDQAIESHRETNAPCYIIEKCRTTDAACEAIERLVKEKDVKHVVVDYAQLLTSQGKGRYEQTTNTSIALRKVASDLNITLLVLCQLNRSIEGRSDFVPLLSDIKETGQFEQDADVIVSIVWPWRVNNSNPFNKYQLYILKNRNRETNDSIIECRIDPARQRLSVAPPETFAERNSPERLGQRTANRRQRPKNPDQFD